MQLSGFVVTIIQVIIFLKDTAIPNILHVICFPLIYNKKKKKQLFKCFTASNMGGKLFRVCIEINTCIE